MAWQHIPADVKRFILLSIPSIPFLEAMLLLRNEAAYAWDGRRLARRLYMEEEAADKLLRDLHAAGFLIVSEKNMSAYHYHPVSDSLRHSIDRLADTYIHNVVEISNLIHSKTSTKDKS